MPSNLFVKNFTDDFNWIYQFIAKLSLFRPEKFELLANLFFKIHVKTGSTIGAFVTSRSSIPFVRKLYQYGVFTTKEIIGLLNLGTDISNFPFKEYLPLDFCRHFREIYIDYDSDYVKYGYSKDSLQYILQNDLLPEFIEYIQKHPNYSEEILPTNVFKTGHISYKISPISFAALSGAYNCFDYMIMNGTDIDNSVAKFAINGGNFKIIDYCEDAGCFYDGCLKGAAEYHRNSIIKWLLDKTTDFPSMISAFKFSNVELIYYMIINKIGDINSIDNRGRNPLNFGVRHLSLNFIKFVIENCQADAYHEDDRNLNMIHLSARYSRYQLVKYFIENKNLGIMNGKLRTPLVCSMSAGSKELVKYLIEKGGPEIVTKKSQRFGDQPINYAVNGNNLEFVKILQNSNADMNGITGGLFGNGENTVIQAVKFCLYDVCKYLIDIGVDLNLKTYTDKNVYYYAAKNCDLDMLILLKERGAKMNGIEMVAAGSSLSIMIWLLNNGSHFENKFHKNSLHTAAQKGTCRELEFILKHGVDMEKKDKYGRTPLHYAAILPKTVIFLNHDDYYERMKKLSLEKVKFLLSKGANVNAADDDGRTVLWRAIHNKNEKLCEFLIDYLIKSGKSKEELRKMKDEADMNIYQYMEMCSADIQCIKDLFCNSK